MIRRVPFHHCPGIAGAGVATDVAGDTPAAVSHLLLLPFGCPSDLRCSQIRSADALRRGSFFSGSPPLGTPRIPPKRPAP